MNQTELLRYAVKVLESQGIVYMVVGSYASAGYGEPRLTNDIDIVLELTFDQADHLCGAFPDPEFYVSQAAARAAATNRSQFNVIHPTSGNKIDFLVRRDDAWGITQLARRIRRPIVPDCDAYLAAPEDVILGKLLYYQEGASETAVSEKTAIIGIH